MEKNQQDKQQDPKKQEPSTAVAVPYDRNYVPVAVAVEAVPVPAVSSANYGQQQYPPQYPPQYSSQYPPQAISGQGVFADVGVCRRCGQQFQRDPRVNESSAQFYRCQRCAQLHLEDFCLIS